MSVHVSGGDLPGLRALESRIREANRSVLVGLPEGAKAEEDGTPVAMIGAVHEFGSPEQNIPERSWLRGGIARGQPKFNRLNRANMALVVLGKKTVEESLGQLGAVAAGEVKREFVVGDFEPIKPATIAARERKLGKKSTRPLIASGNLRQEITWQLEAPSANARVIR